MKSKLFSKVVPVAAIAAGAMLVFSLSPGVYAAPVATAVKPPKVTPTAAPALPPAPVSVTMAQLNQRMAQIPQLAGVKDGNTIIISDDGSVTDAKFQGNYVFHPAGSTIKLGPLYARWKDGLVAIQMNPQPIDPTDPNGPTTLKPFATYIEQTFGKGKDYLGNDNQVVTSQQQIGKFLIPEPTNNDILKTPDGTWLFRDNGDGTVTALTDVFTFQSGGQPLVWETTPTSGSSIWNPDGAQPVGVANQY